MGRVAGIGSRGDGSGAQPYIFDPTLGKEYQALPQLDPNRGADTNLTTFGKFMRKAGGPIVANMMGPAAPIAGAMLLANKYPDKVPSFLTGRGTYSPAYDEPIGPNLPTRFATSDQNAPNPFSETSSTSTLGSALSRIQSPYPQKRPTASELDGQRMVNLNDPKGSMGTSDIGALSAFDRPQLRPASMNVSSLDDANKGETIMVDGFSNSYAKKVPVSTYFRMNDPLPNYNDDNFDQVMPPPEEPETGTPLPYADYAQWMPNSEYIGASSYGGPFSSASQNFASVLPSSIYSRGGSSNSVPTRFVNDRTKQYFTAPNDSYYAEENSDWRQANPYSLA